MPLPQDDTLPTGNVAGASSATSAPPEPGSMAEITQMFKQLGEDAAAEEEGEDDGEEEDDDADGEVNGQVGGVAGGEVGENGLTEGGKKKKKKKKGKASKAVAKLK